MHHISLALICMLCYGIFDYLIAGPARKISGLQLLLIFSFFNSCFLFVLMVVFESQISINSYLVYPILTGIFGHLGVFLYSKSLYLGKIGISSSITNAYPFIAVMLGYLLLGEYLSLYQWLFFILILIGIIFISFHISEITKFKIERDKSSLFYSFSAMLSYAFFVYFFDRSVVYFDSIFAAFTSEIFIFTTLIVYMFFNNKNRLGLYQNINKNILISIAYISILGMIGFVSLGSAFQFGSLAVVAAIAACSPAVTTLLARLFGDEKLDNIQYIAILILVLGISGLSYFSI